MMTITILHVPGFVKKKKEKDMILYPEQAYL